MAGTIQLKRSTTAGSVPSSLAAGEVAINHADRKLFVNDVASAVRGVDLTSDQEKATNPSNPVAINAGLHAGMYGALGNDSAADGAALAALSTTITDAALATMGATGKLRPGVYHCDRKIVLRPTSKMWAGLVSDGVHGAKIMFTNPMSCGIEVILPRQSGVGRAATPSVTIRGIDLMALFNASDIVSTDGTIPGTEDPYTGARKTRASVIGGASAGARLAGVALDVHFDNGSGAIAAPTPSFDLAGVSIEHYSDEDIQPSTGGWAIGIRVRSMNQVSLDAPVFNGFYTGSIGLDFDTKSGDISVEHTINDLRFHGKNCVAVQIGKVGNDVPLQGLIFKSPTIVIAGGSGRGIVAVASPTASHDIGDHLEINGGHIAVPGGIGVYALGFGSIQYARPYSLASGIHLYAEQCARIHADGIFSQGGTSGARAVQLVNCATDTINADAGSIIDGMFDAFDVPPVSLQGTTSGTLTRGISNAKTLLPLVQDQTGNNLNFYHGVCNQRLSNSKPNIRAISDETATANWVLGAGANVGNTEYIVSVNTPTTADTVAQLFTFTQPVQLSLPSPSSCPMASTQIQNLSGGNASVAGSGVPSELSTLKDRETVWLQSIGGAWRIRSRSKITAPA